MLAYRFPKWNGLFLKQQNMVATNHIHKTYIDKQDIIYKLDRFYIVL